VSELCGERVGYSFTGTLTGTTSVSLFGYNVPRPSPIVGTFSFDTTVPGVDGATGVRTYHQLIQGGYTLDINNGQVQLSANDYTITVSNNTGANQTDSFTIDYNYPTLTSTRILEHNTPWSGTRAFIKLQMTWPGTTFTDPDEPKLTADRPPTPNPTFTAFVGSSPAPVLFTPTPNSISVISPQAGDYNYDGKFDYSDYIEWRKIFDGPQAPTFSENNGIDDLADYVVWRKAQSASAAELSLAAIVPEPASLLLIGAGIALFAIGRRRSQK
jgi:hypothetical protein